MSKEQINQNTSKGREYGSCALTIGPECGPVIGPIIILPFVTLGLIAATGYTAYFIIKATGTLYLEARSYDLNTRELKYLMLDMMNQDKTVGGIKICSDFLIAAQNQYKGKSQTFMSAKSSKQFDTNQYRMFWKRDLFQDIGMNDLMSYMGDNTSGGNNSGRTFYNIVMTTRSLTWIENSINEMTSDEVKVLAQAIIEKYCVGLTSSGISKKLYNELKDNLKNSSKLISVLSDFLQDTTTQAKSNDKKFKMLTIIEQETTRICYNKKLTHVASNTSSNYSREENHNSLVTPEPQNYKRHIIGGTKNDDSGSRQEQAPQQRNWW